MKVLGIVLITPISPQSATRKALSELGTDGYVEFDWKTIMENDGVISMREQLVAILQDFKPDFTWMQLQTADILTQKEFDAIHGFKVSWCGDVRQPMPAFYSDIAKGVTVSAFTNMNYVDRLVAEGYDARYLQTGFSDDVFYSRGYNRTSGIVFMGTYYSGQFPLSEARKDMVNNLRKTWGMGFSVYGNNWSRECRYKCESQEAEIYNRAKIAVIQSHFNDIGRYSSDRLWRAMGCGIMCLVNHYPGIELEFEIGKHLDTWKTLDELNEKIQFYLDRPELREQIGLAGYELAHSQCTWKHRINQAVAWYGDWKKTAKVAEVQPVGKKRGRPSRKNKEIV